MTTIENGVPKLLVSEPTELNEGSISRFVQYVKDGIESWLKAGKLLVQMVETNPNTYSIITKENPHITIDMLLTFERIGRQEVYPYLLLDKNHCSTKLLRYPFDLQVKYCKEPVRLLTGFDKKGKPEVVEKLAHRMTKQEIELAFSPKGLRSIDDQALLLHKPVAKPIISSSVPRKLKSIGFFRAVERFGKLEMAKTALAGSNAQRVVLENNDGVMQAIIEITKWEDVK